MEDIYKIIDELELQIGPKIEHLFDISKCSIEAQRFLEVFSEDEIICNAKYKNHNGLPYEYDESLKDKETKIFLGNYDGIDEYHKVSPEHFDHLNNFKWYLKRTISKSGAISEYATTKIGKYNYLMHIYIQGYIKRTIVDHINGDSTDNTYNNLRNATNMQNGQNKSKKLDKKGSVYIGVHYHNNHKKYIVKFSNIDIGYFTDEIEAAKLYDTYVLLHPNLGKHSKTNNLISWDEIKDLKFEDIFPKKKQREYPKNIYYCNTHNKFCIKFRYNYKTYQTYTKTLDEAYIKKEEFEIIINNLKKEKLENYLSVKINKNINNQAILIIKDNQYIIDDEDWHNITFNKWIIDKDNYAYNSKFERLHRYLKKDIINEIYLLYPDANLVIDHINNNIYDNRKSNLRINSHTGNMHNKISIKQNFSKYKYVSKGTTNKFRVKIYKNNISFNLGTYETDLQAGIAALICKRKLYKSYMSEDYNISIDDFMEHKDIIINQLKLITKVINSKYL